MHESAIAHTIWDTAQNHAHESTIVCMTIQVGSLSGVVTDSLLFYLECFAQEGQKTVPEFTIENVAASFQCCCGKLYKAADMMTPCPACGGFQRDVTGGTQCMLTSIEVDDDENNPH